MACLWANALFPSPLQWQAGWPTNPNLGDLVIPRSLWQIASGVRATTFQPSQRPGGTSCHDDEYIQLTGINAAATSLMAANSAALRNAAKQELPETMKVVAVTGKMPNVLEPLTAYDCTPYANFAM